MSVTADGRLLMVGEDPLRLDIYGSDSRLVHSVDLPGDMCEPRHAVETTRNTFVISHGWVDSPLHRVCEVTGEGRLLRAFGGKSGTGDDQLDGPIHLAINMSNKVYVADLSNNRVLMLDETLERSKIVFTADKNDIDQPWCLCYVADSSSMDKLLVGQLSKRADVYGVRCSR
jgi:hypothetical protein